MEFFKKQTSCKCSRANYFFRENRIIMKSLSTTLVYKFLFVTMLLLTSFSSFGKADETSFPEKLNTENSDIDDTQFWNSISLNYTLSNDAQSNEFSITPLLFDLEKSLEFLPPPTDSVCTYTTADTFWINTVPDAISYDWIVPTGATFTQPLGDTLIIIDWSSATVGTDSIGIAAANVSDLAILYFSL